MGHLHGQSRSAATVIAYLVAETETSLQDAYALCKVAVDNPWLVASTLALPVHHTNVLPCNVGMPSTDCCLD